MYGIDSLPHLREASKQKVDVFVTVNDSVLADRVELEFFFGLKIRTPEDVLHDEILADIDASFELVFAKITDLNRRASELQFLLKKDRDV